MGVVSIEDIHRTVPTRQRSTYVHMHVWQYLVRTNISRTTPTNGTTNGTRVRVPWYHGRVRTLVRTMVHVYQWYRTFQVVFEIMLFLSWNCTRYHVHMGVPVVHVYRDVFRVLVFQVVLEIMYICTRVCVPWYVHVY